MNGQPRAKTQDRIGMIDVIAQDTKTGEVVLRMDELDPWDGSDERLLALQERFNAYVSFLLDGEMASEHPELVGAIVSCGGRPDLAREHLRSVHAPTLLIVGSNDPMVAELNRQAAAELKGRSPAREVKVFRPGGGSMEPSWRSARLIVTHGSPVRACHAKLWTRSAQSA